MTGSIQFTYIIAASRLIACGTLLLLSVFLFLKNKTHRSVFAFGLFCFVMGIWQFDLYGLHVMKNLEALYAWRRIPRICTYLFAPFMLNFIYTFINKNRKSFFFVFVWIIGISFALYRFIYYRGEAYLRGEYYYVPAPSPILLSWYIYTFSICFLGIFLLFQYYKKTDLSREKLQLKYFLMALVLLIPLNLDSVLASMGVKIYYATGPFATVVFTFIIAYAILKYRLMDIDVVIKRVTYFTMLLLVVTTPFYYGVTYLHERIYRYFGSHSFIVSALPWAILILFLDKLKSFLQKVTDKIFFLAEYNYEEELAVISQKVNDIVDIESLVQTFTSELRRVLKVESVNLIVIDRSEPRYKVLGTPFDQDLNLDTDHVLIRKLKKSRDNYFFAGELKPQVDFNKNEINQIKSYMSYLNAEFITAVLYKGQIVGMLSASQKKSGKSFTEKDINLMSYLLNQSLLVISKIYEIEEKAIIKTEKELEEKHSKELRSKNELLQKQNVELEKAYRQIREQEAKIIQQEKLAILGDIVAGVAHEINTPLLAISVGMNYFNEYFRKLRDYYDGKLKKQDVENDRSFKLTHDDFPTDISVLFVALERIRSHIRDLKSFIKFQEETGKDFNVNQELSTTINIVNFKLPSNVRIETKFDYEIPMATGNAAEINQVFMNVIINGIEAIPRDIRGVILIRTYSRNKNKKVVVEIEDNGTGMDESVRKRLFLEKFTTKKQTGTGLGLTICHEIVKRHHGEIEVESEVGKGSSFRIVLRAA